MSIDVFAADEQADHPIAVGRWAELSQKVLTARGVKGETEVSLLFVDEDAIAALNEQFLGKSGPFTGATVENGHDAAYDLPTITGSYGAIWSQTTSDKYCTSTAAFKAATQ